MLKINRSGQPQDTSAHGIRGAAGDPEATWTVGGIEADAAWQALTPGGHLTLAARPGSGRLERLELQLRCFEGAIDRSQILLQWESSPAPDANEAGARPRLIDGSVPLSALCGDGSAGGLWVARQDEGASALASALVDADGVHRLKVQLPMPYRDGLRLRLVYPAVEGSERTQPVYTCRWHARGCVAPPPADGRYLRAQWLTWNGPGIAPPAGVPGEEHTLFEAHGRGGMLALIATGAAANPAGWVATWFIDGDERLQQIEEIPGARLMEQGRLPIFAEYIKCTLRWTPPALSGGVASVALFAHVEDRPIA